MFDVVGKHSIADPVCRPFTITWSGYLHSRAYSQCLIQDKISTSPSQTDRRAVAARSPHGRHIGRYFYLMILPLLIILLSLKSNFIIL